MSVKAVLAGLAQAVSPPHETPAFRRPGGEWSRGALPRLQQVLIIWSQKTQVTWKQEAWALAHYLYDLDRESLLTLASASREGRTQGVPFSTSPAVPHLQVWTMIVSRESQVPVCQG